MKNKDKPPKEIENSSLRVLLKIDERIDENGQLRIRGEWIEATAPVSLGSMKEPNKDILQVKIRVPPQDRDDNNPFRRMFGG